MYKAVGGCIKPGSVAQLCLVSSNGTHESETNVRMRKEMDRSSMTIGLGENAQKQGDYKQQKRENNYISIKRQRATSQTVSQQSAWLKFPLRFPA